MSIVCCGIHHIGLLHTQIGLLAVSVVMRAS